MSVVLRPAISLLFFFTLLTGAAYPLLVTGVGQLAFPHQANGSRIGAQGRVVGSELIGQPFRSPGYFWGRPSATVAFPYDAAASAGSNLGPVNPALLDAVRARTASLSATLEGARLEIPVELVTSSASGLDPHLSPASAQLQAARVARARGLSPRAVEALITSSIEGRTLGILGEPRVNVLRLNLELDHLAPWHGARSGPDGGPTR